MELSIYFLLVLLTSASSIVESRKFMIYSQSGRPFRGGWLATNVMEIHNEVDEDANDQKAIKDAGDMDDHLQSFLERVSDGEAGISRMWQSITLPFEWNHLPSKTFQLPTTQRHFIERDSGTFICNTCMDIATRAEQVVSDPDMPNRILEIMKTSICPLVMPGQQEECVNLTESYISRVFQLLKENLTPEHLCVDTKLCASPTAFLHYNAMCQKCEEYAAEALNRLTKNSTETEVLYALHFACSKMEMFSSKCNALVDIYGPTIFLEVQSTTPKEVCQKIKLCNAFRKQKNYCATCEYVVLQMKAQLHDPVNQEKLIKSLSEECTKVPNYTDKCKEIVAQYASFILANMDSLLDADTVCTKIHACEAIPASRMDPAQRIKRSEETKETSEGTTEPLIQLPYVSHEHVVQ